MTALIILQSILAVVGIIAIIVFVIYLVRANQVMRTVKKWINNYEGKMLNVVDAKELTKEEADERMELVYFETPLGFHIGLDFTYLDQEGNFKILLPTGEVIDTSLTDPDKD